MRPRGISGLLRSRAPLFLVLWLAAREGRLVWQSRDCFALLEPPRAGRGWHPATGDPRLAALRFADRQWDLLIFLFPPAILMTWALCLGLAFEDSAAALLAALSLTTLAVLYDTVLMGSMVLYQGIKLCRVLLRRGGDELIRQNAPFLHWTLPLCHSGAPSDLGSLIDQIYERFHRLIIYEAEEAARQKGVRVRPTENFATLVYLLDGATSPEAEQALYAATDETREYESGTKILFMASPGEREPPGYRMLDSGAFVFFILAGIIVFVLVDAMMVPDWERRACAPADCAGRPTTYGSALEWSASQLIGASVLRPLGLDLPGPVARSAEATTIGVLSGLFPPVLVMVAVSAARRNKSWRTRSKVRFEERKITVTTKTRVLIMVASDVEHRAVFDAVAAANRVSPRPWYCGQHTVFRMGTLSAADVLLTRCGQGSLGPGASTLTAQSVLDQVRPDFLILVGIGYGLMREGQRLGDVMVSTQMRVMDHKEVVDSVVGGGATVEYQRGPRPDASVLLVDRAQSAELLGWEGPKVHFGPMLAMNTRVSSPAFYERLVATEPDAVGGEMEGSGVYAAGAKGRVEWIVIKGISDWGDRDERAREKAAGSAARFVVHMIESGGLNRPPAG